MKKNPADPLYQAGLRPLLVEKFMSQMKYQTRCLSRYTRSKLGFAFKKGTSLYDLVVDALAKDGIKKQEGESSKKFVIKNLEYIKKIAIKTPFSRISYRDWETDRKSVV